MVCGYRSEIGSMDEESEMGVQYENLKKFVISKSQGSVDLEFIKECFSPVIKSPRAISRIENIGDLFRLLERRCLLKCKNVSSLEYIGTVSKNQEIIKSVQGYKKINFLLDEDVCICGQEISLCLPVVNPEEENSVEYDKLSGLEIAFNNIASNIGERWNVLARELNVPEFYIDEVSDKYPCDVFQQALKILEIWKNYNKEEATLDVLKKALESRLCGLKGIGIHLLQPTISV